jgi:DNA modification methylase
VSEPYWSAEGVTLYLGDCLTVLPGLPDNSIDAICTDPPYGLEFMGREWDGADGFRRSLNEADAGRDSVFGRTSRTSPEYQTGRFVGAVTDRDFKGFVLSQQRTRNVKCPDCGKWAYDHPGRLCECGGIRRAQVNVFQSWCEAWADECLRVLKPGGWMLAFGGTRTWHRLTCAIEDAGFEIRDSTADLTGIDGPGLLWLYGSGFPKSLDVSKAIDKHLGATRPIVETIPDRWAGKGDVLQRATQDVRAEAHITSSATAAAAAAAEGWGTALKPSWEPIVVARKPLSGTVAQNVLAFGTGALNIDGCRLAVTDDDYRRNAPGDRGQEGTNREMDFRFTAGRAHDAGRWPPNVVLGPGAAEELDRQSGMLTSGTGAVKRASAKGGAQSASIGAESRPEGTPMLCYGDTGGASRFFPVFRYEAKAGTAERPRLEDGTAHPTVKPVDLMAWLVRLVTPPGGLVLDPFAGSGTTAEACIVEGFHCILIEQDPKSAELIKTRLSKPIQPAMLTVDDSAPAAPVRPVAASRPKPESAAHPSLFDELEAS